MFEKKHKSKKKTFDLPKYNLQISESSTYLSCASLKIDNLCELICILEVRQSKDSEDSGTIQTTISSFCNETKLKYNKYIQR